MEASSTDRTIAAYFSEFDTTPGNSQARVPFDTDWIEGLEVRAFMRTTHAMYVNCFIDRAS